MSDHKRHIPRLISLIKENAAEILTKDGDHRAATQLAEIGAPEISPILKAMGGPSPKGQHPIDVIEALGSILNEIARRNPEPPIEILQNNAAPADPQMFFVVTALGESADERALDALIVALKHSAKTVRYGAASALVRMKKKRAVAPLIEALRDKSSLVKFTIVDTMKRRTDLRDVRALEPLKRIVASQRLKKNSPGLHTRARELITQIETESKIESNKRGRR